MFFSDPARSPGFLCSRHYSPEHLVWVWRINLTTCQFFIQAPAHVLNSATVFFALRYFQHHGKKNLSQNETGLELIGDQSDQVKLLGICKRCIFHLGKSKNLKEKSCSDDDVYLQHVWLRVSLSHSVFFFPFLWFFQKFSPAFGLTDGHVEDLKSRV